MKWPTSSCVCNLKFFPGYGHWQQLLAPWCWRQVFSQTFCLNPSCCMTAPNTHFLITRANHFLKPRALVNLLWFKKIATPQWLVLGRAPKALGRSGRNLWKPNWKNWSARLSRGFGRKLSLVVSPLWLKDLSHQRLITIPNSCGRVSLVLRSMAWMARKLICNLNIGNWAVQRLQLSASSSQPIGERSYICGEEASFQVGQPHFLWDDKQQWSRDRINDGQSRCFDSFLSIAILKSVFSFRDDWTLKFNFNMIE